MRLFKCETITNAEALQSHPDCSLEDDCNDVMLGGLDEASIEGDSIEDVDFMPESPKLPSSSSQEVLNSRMQTPLPRLARECDRWGSIGSHRLFWLIVRIIDAHDSSDVIDPNKIRRERQKKRKTLQAGAFKTLEGLYFDGRKDRTRSQIVKGNIYHPALETKEHIVLIKEPGSEYLGHVKTSQGSSQSIQIALYHF